MDVEIKWNGLKHLPSNTVGWRGGEGYGCMWVGRARQYDGFITFLPTQ